MSDTLTTSQAARFLRVSTSTLKRWTAAGAIRCERTSGGHRRFRRSELAEFLSTPARANDEPARWADLLLGTVEPLQLQSRLFEMRVRLGSWWVVAERLMAVVFEIERRRDAGDVTVVQLQCGLERFVRLIGWALAHLPRCADAPNALLTAAPGDRQSVTLALVELCLGAQGWRTCWAGPASSADIADELKRRRPDVLFVGACPSSDRAVLARLARDVAAIAHDTGTAVTFVGLGEWPDSVDGTVRLHAFPETRAWVDQFSVKSHESIGRGSPLKGSRM